MDRHEKPDWGFCSKDWVYVWILSTKRVENFSYWNCSSFCYKNCFSMDQKCFFLLCYWCWVIAQCFFIAVTDCFSNELLTQQRTIAIKCRMLYNHSNRKYKKITFRICKEAKYIIFLSVSIFTAMECIKHIHMNALEIYLHDHSGNNKVFPSAFLWNCVSCLLPLNLEKCSPLRYAINIAWMELFEKKKYFKK